MKETYKELLLAAIQSGHEVTSELTSTLREEAKFLTAEQPQEPEQLVPAVPVKKSVHEDYIICLEDGKKMKLLKRYVMREYGLTPDEYRQKWGLPYDYPMVAPNYAKKRSQLAKENGLGKRSKTAE